MERLLYIYQWQGGRIAIFSYQLVNPPKALQFNGKFDNPTDLYNAINLFAKFNNNNNKTLSYSSFKSIRLSEFTFEKSCELFDLFFPSKQLKLDL
jgi:hypothetical protein